MGRLLWLTRPLPTPLQGDYGVCVEVVQASTDEPLASPSDAPPPPAPTASASVAPSVVPGYLLPNTTDGSCGAPNYQYSCGTCSCCGSFGFCGSSVAYCGIGCQASVGWMPGTYLHCLAPPARCRPGMACVTVSRHPHPLSPRRPRLSPRHPRHLLRHLPPPWAGCPSRMTARVAPLITSSCAEMTTAARASGTAGPPMRTVARAASPGTAVVPQPSRRQRRAQPLKRPSLSTTQTRQMSILSTLPTPRVIVPPLSTQVPRPVLLVSQASQLLSPLSLLL